MPAITLTQAREMLAAALAAERRALEGRSAQWGDRVYTAQEVGALTEIRIGWQRTVASLENDTAPARYAVSDFSGRHP